eukprot:913591-Pyramimonas_sp.AAC.1
MGSYTQPTRSVREPKQSLHALYGILDGACTPCHGSYTEPKRPVWDRTQRHTRPVWDPIQNLHGLCGILYTAYTARLGSNTEHTRPEKNPIQSLHA